MIQAQPEQPPSDSNTQENTFYLSIPRWVPIAVQLEIEKRHRFFVTWLERNQQEMALNTVLGKGNAAEISDRRRHIERMLSTIERLTKDEQMKEVWPALEVELKEDDLLARFADCAWCANFSLAEENSRYEQLNAARKRLASKIADKAKHLASLLREFREVIGPDGDDFLSVRRLLNVTSSSDPMWDAFKDCVINARTGSEGHLARKAWETSPSIDKCVDTLGAEIEDLKISRDGPVGIAIDTARFNLRMGYLRAFAFLLLANGVPISQRLEETIAATATVILEDSDIVEKSQVHRAVQQVREALSASSYSTDPEMKSDSETYRSREELIETVLFGLRKMQASGEEVSPELAGLMQKLTDLSKPPNR